MSYEGLDITQFRSIDSPTLTYRHIKIYAYINEDGGMYFYGSFVVAGRGLLQSICIHRNYFSFTKKFFFSSQRFTIYFLVVCYFYL